MVCHRVLLAHLVVAPTGLLFVFMMRSSTWDFFHRLVAMGPTPPTRTMTMNDPTTR